MRRSSRSALAAPCPPSPPVPLAYAPSTVPHDTASGLAPPAAAPRSIENRCSSALRGPSALPDLAQALSRPLCATAPGRGCSSSATRAAPAGRPALAYPSTARLYALGGGMRPSMWRRSPSALSSGGRPPGPPGLPPPEDDDGGDDDRILHESSTAHTAWGATPPLLPSLPPPPSSASLRKRESARSVPSYDLRWRCQKAASVRVRTSEGVRDPTGVAAGSSRRRVTPSIRRPCASLLSATTEAGGLGRGLGLGPDLAASAAARPRPRSRPRSRPCPRPRPRPFPSLPLPARDPNSPERDREAALRAIPPGGRHRRKWNIAELILLPWSVGAMAVGGALHADGGLTYNIILGMCARS